MSDLDEAIRLTYEASKATPEDSPDRPKIFYTLALHLQDRYKETKNLPDIEEAIQATRTAIDITSIASQRAKYLTLLGQQLYERNKSMLTAVDLEEAIRVTQIGLTITPEGLGQAEPLALLGCYLYYRYRQNTRIITDLEEAIRVTQIATEVALEADLNKATYSFWLGCCLAERYSVNEDPADLEDAIQAMQVAVDITPPGTSRVRRLTRLAGQLTTKYQRTETIAVLEHAIRILWTAVDETMAESPQMVTVLRQLESRVLRKYLETNAVEDLNELIRVDRAIINSTTEDDGLRDSDFASLGSRLWKRYSRTGDKASLEEAILLTQAAIDRSLKDSSAQKLFLKQLRVLLRDRSMGIGPISNLHEEVIHATRMAVEATPADIHDKTEVLTSFMVHVDELCDTSEAFEDIEEAIRVIQKAIDATPTCHPIRVVLYRYLAGHLDKRHEWTDDVADLNESIRVLKEAVNIAPKGHVCLSAISSSLMAGLDLRYKTTEAAADLDDAIEFLKAVIDTDPVEDLPRFEVLRVLGTYLGDRYKKTGAIRDLEEAIKFAREGIDIATGDGKRWRLLNVLGPLLGTKYQRTRATVDLEDAIRFTQTAVDKAPSKLNRAFCLNNLGHLLNERYASTDSITDLEDAIRVTREALENTVAGPNHPIYFRSLSIHLCDKFSRTGIIAHLEEAIRMAQAAVAIVSKDDPHQALYLGMLGYSLHLRYLEINAKSDLEEAIRVTQEAVDSTQQDASEKAKHLNSLCVYLAERYRRTGVKADLDEAVRAAHIAVDATPKDHPNRAKRLQNLGNRLGDLYTKTGVMDELQQAICVTKEAVDITSADPDGGAEALDNLGRHLAERYKKSGEVIDVDEAIRVTRAAADITPKGLQRARYLENLALHISERCRKMQTMAGLNEAVQAAEAAVEATPEDHPNRAEMLSNLGTRLKEKFSRTNAAQDLEIAILCHQSALRQPNAYLLTRIEAGIDVLQCCALNSDWQQAYEALHVAVGLVPLLTLRSLQNSDKQHLLGQVAGLASDAAAAAFNAAKEPHVALELLEQGRGLLAASLEEMRTDVVVLRQKHPDLAEEFVRLQGEINLQVTREKPYSRGDRGSPFQVRTSKLYEADNAFDLLLVDIRNRPGFTNFLLPPSTDEMQAAANDGPIIVINVSEYRCDAVLVERDQIRVLALPNLRSYEVDEKTLQGNLGAPHVLAWLWDVVAKPVLDALGYTCCPLTGNWPRVWWIPTGSLSRFPLHAAGRHGEGEGESVLDRVMSSYSSSIKAIIHGRQLPVLEVVPSTPTQALLVAMQNTPGHTQLHFADREVEKIRDICKAIPISSIDPGQLRHDIIAHLPHCSIFHFAGHGYTDSLDPSQSHLAVYNDKITVATLLEMNLRERSPFLAYLSACGTGQIKDDRFLDESIHLMSAFQLAGFRHVIGTLWEVNDELCTEMARATYEGIRDRGMTDKSVCLGLHNASRELRNNWLTKRLEVNSRKGGDSAVVLNEYETGMASTRDGSKGDPRLSRDAVLCIKDGQYHKGERPPLWIPYVHFGV
jgi:tetratricopeptide (TPR) repeat protein